jgi:hypothetical protein
MPASLGVAAPAAPGLTFFDCDSPLDRVAARAFKDAGFAAAARYLSLDMGQVSGDLSTAEAAILIGAGLAIVPVQHVRRAGWVPSALTGAHDGRAAGWNAGQLGVPKGVVLWLDLEGVADAVQPRDIIGHVTSWMGAVGQFGYTGGIYAGANCGLDPAQLYDDLATRHYWHSGSRAAPIPAVRGVQAVQRIENLSLAGLGYDRNITQTDLMGDNLIWWAPAA